jgi:hypothetical protein
VSLGKEISRVEHAIERYQDAFEAGNPNPARFNERLSGLDARLDSLRGQDQALARDLAADTPTTPDTAALNAVADHLGQVIETATPTKPKHCCASSSPSYASTAATRSCPPTASAHPWFAHRQVQWSYPGANSCSAAAESPAADDVDGWPPDKTEASEELEPPPFDPPSVVPPPVDAPALPDPEPEDAARAFRPAA